MRYDLYINDEIFMEGRIKAGDPPLMCEGSFVFFLPSDNEVFLDIVEVH